MHLDERGWVAKELMIRCWEDEGGGRRSWGVGGGGGGGVEGWGSGRAGMGDLM